jgi:hypothetical protein
VKTSGIRIEMELEYFNKLRALITELATALNCWADAKDSPELDNLLRRAKEAQKFPPPNPCTCACVNHPSGNCRCPCARHPWTAP